LWGAVNDILESAEDGEQRALDSAYSFCHRVGRKEFQFDDFFEHRFTQYTYRFIWCCYALAWGVAMYDSKTSGMEKAA